MFSSLFRIKGNKTKYTRINTTNSPDTVKISNKNHVAVRKGEIGEYKINIQLDQFPREYRYLSDIMINNPKSISGFSQIDHVLLTPYGIFVIETKNYQGTIYGGKEQKVWSVNGKFKMMNPFIQNYGHIKVLMDFLDSKLHEHIFSIVTFTKRCTFKVDLEMRKISSNELIVYDIELSEFINRKISVLKLQHHLPIFSAEEIETIYSRIIKANITDSTLREKHKSVISKTKADNERSDKLLSSQKCKVCNQPVSEKVAAFCLSNAKFQGKVYCFNHQKNV